MSIKLKQIIFLYLCLFILSAFIYDNNLIFHFKFPKFKLSSNTLTHILTHPHIYIAHTFTHILTHPLKYTHTASHTHTHMCIHTRPHTHGFSYCSTPVCSSDIYVDLFWGSWGCQIIFKRKASNRFYVDTGLASARVVIQKLKKKFFLHWFHRSSHSFPWEKNPRTLKNIVTVPTNVEGNRMVSWQLFS